MAYNAIVNAAPFINLLGTQDSSTRELVPEPIAVPTHLPKFYIWAQKGPLTPQLCVGGSRSLIYGVDSFDLRSKYANHATLFANGINAEGNTCMYQRVLPPDAGPEANIQLSLEVTETTIDDYEREIDGSIKVDATTGEPVVKGQIEGFKVRWLVSSSDTVDDLDAKYGLRTVAQGTTQNANGEYGQVYPIMDIKASFVGDVYNNSGIRIWAPSERTIGAFDPRIMDIDKIYPFRIAVIRKNKALSTSNVVETMYGEQSVLTTFKPGAINSYTDQQMNIEDNFIQAYNNVDDPQYPPVYGDFGSVFVYNNNVQELIKKFYEKEKQYLIDHPEVDAESYKFGDVNLPTVDGDEWMFNMISGTTFDLYPYHTYQLSNEDADLILGPKTDIMAAGSSDGTMDDDTFAKIVKEKVSEYLDDKSQLMNTALNVESIIYDSGFPLDTKKALASFISQRKDTFVALSTHEIGGFPLTASEDYSRAQALKAYLEFYPESDYFGTPVMRGLIMGRSGRLRNSQFKERVSPLYEVAVKAARYMGAGNGVWKSGYSPEGAPNSILSMIYDISVPYTPVSVRNRDWDVGLNWVQSYDLRSNFIPALKTVYSDDTSVLNSFFTAMIICELNKVAEQAWRYYSGRSDLTLDQIKLRIDSFIRNRTEGRFDGRVIIEPETYYTEADLARGYSGTTRIKIYANNMWTVSTTYIQAFRMSDYTQSSS